MYETGRFWSYRSWILIGIHRAMCVSGEVCVFVCQHAALTPLRTTSEYDITAKTFFLISKTGSSVSSAWLQKSKHNKSETFGYHWRRRCCCCCLRRLLFIYLFLFFFVGSITILGFERNGWFSFVEVRMCMCYAASTIVCDVIFVLSIYRHLTKRTI